jgi:hypothetical protein
MEQYDDHHDFCFRHGAVSVIFALFAVPDGIFFHLRIKKSAKIICNTENFCNFVLGKHSDFFSLFCF